MVGDWSLSLSSSGELLLDGRLQFQFLWNFPRKFGSAKVSVAGSAVVDRFPQIQVSEKVMSSLF